MSHNPHSLEMMQFCDAMGFIVQDEAFDVWKKKKVANDYHKDWDAWQKSFEDGKQERIDNGLTVRVVGHDPDDNKKVSLVTAVMDTAKASAYWKSDMLKKRRAAGGVIGEPKRFVFTIARRY